MTKTGIIISDSSNDSLLEKAIGYWRPALALRLSESDPFHGFLLVHKMNNLLLTGFGSSVSRVSMLFWQGDDLARRQVLLLKYKLYKF